MGGAMVQYKQGDLLQAPVEALVNTVNTVGVMGKGVALQFKRAYPENYRAYEAACRKAQVQIGRIFVFDRGPLSRPRYILNFPTKKHWRQPSRLEYVREGLADLVRQVAELGIRSLALPPLGVGNGGLDWAVVRPLIEEAFAGLPEVEVWVFEPQPGFQADLAPASSKPHLTPARAALLKLFALYSALGEPVGRLEAQKLAYFLQEAAMPLKLNFVKQQYGPYAENLNPVLQRLEGYYLRGYGDRNTPSAMQLAPGALDEAVAFLADHPEADEAVSRAAELIEGFDSPYGLELLATVHWAFTREGAQDWASLLKVVRAWSPRKERFPEAHLRVAAEHLAQKGWLPQPVADSV